MRISGCPFFQIHFSNAKLIVHNKINVLVDLTKIKIVKTYFCQYFYALKIPMKIKSTETTARFKGT